LVFVIKRALHNHWHFHYNNATTNKIQTDKLSLTQDEVSTTFSIQNSQTVFLSTTTVSLIESNIPLATTIAFQTNENDINPTSTIPPGKKIQPTTTTNSIIKPSTVTANLPSNTNSLIQGLSNPVSITIYSGVSILILVFLILITLFFVKKFKKNLITKKKKRGDSFDDIFVRNSIIDYTERIREARSTDETKTFV
ncbi:hypothetical protein HDU92_008285, partial [Lobulomyces angularis]